MFCALRQVVPHIRPARPAGPLDFRANPARCRVFLARGRPSLRWHERCNSTMEMGATDHGCQGGTGPVGRYVDYNAAE